MVLLTCALAPLLYPHERALVCARGPNKLPRPGGVNNTDLLVLEPASPGSRCWQGRIHSDIVWLAGLPSRGGHAGPLLCVCGEEGGSESGVSSEDTNL